MAQVISAIQEKGGSGKSTALAIIAHHLAKDGAKTIVIDTDPQQTIFEWAEGASEGIPNFDRAAETDEDKIGTIIKAAKSQYDVVLVDTAGIHSQMVYRVAANSDLILVPTRACKPDMKGLIKTLRKIAAVKEDFEEREIQALAVRSDWNQTTNIARLMDQQLKAGNIPAIISPIFSRTGFLEAFTSGTGPQGKAEKVAKEFIGAMQIQKLLEFYNGQRNIVRHQRAV